MKRHAEAHWEGTGETGKGTLSTPSKILDKTGYTFKTRFKDEEGKAGTNPEELIAAAHAGCFTMALSFTLQQAGHTAEELDTTATVTLDSIEGGFEISGIQLKLVGKVPGVSESEFKEMAEGAKANCPVSKALKAVPISLDIEFKG
jgi:osmotically inducible protein OsmC